MWGLILVVQILSVELLIRQHALHFIVLILLVAAVAAAVVVVVVARAVKKMMNVIVVIKRFAILSKNIKIGV